MNPLIEPLGEDFPVNLKVLNEIRDFILRRYVIILRCWMSICADLFSNKAGDIEDIRKREERQEPFASIISETFNKWLTYGPDVTTYNKLILIFHKYDKNLSNKLNEVEFRERLREKTTTLDSDKITILNNSNNKCICLFLIAILVLLIMAVILFVIFGIIYIPQFQNGNGTTNNGTHFPPLNIEAASTTTLSSSGAKTSTEPINITDFPDIIVTSTTEPNEFHDYQTFSLSKPNSVRFPCHPDKPISLIIKSTWRVNWKNGKILPPASCKMENVLRLEFQGGDIELESLCFILTQFKNIRHLIFNGSSISLSSSSYDISTSYPNKITLPHLEELIIENGQIQISFYKVLEKLDVPNLQTLTISHTELSVYGRKSIGNLITRSRKLRYLFLIHVKVGKQKLFTDEMCAKLPINLQIIIVFPPLPEDSEFSGLESIKSYRECARLQPRLSHSVM